MVVLPTGQHLSWTVMPSGSEQQCLIEYFSMSFFLLCKIALKKNGNYDSISFNDKKQGSQVEN